MAISKAQQLPVTPVVTMPHVGLERPKKKLFFLSHPCGHSHHSTREPFSAVSNRMFLSSSVGVSNVKRSDLWVRVFLSDSLTPNPRSYELSAKRPQPSISSKTRVSSFELDVFRL